MPAPATQVDASPLPEDTHPLAREWYESLKISGQSQLYEPSDWASARILAAVMTRMLEAPRPSAQMLSVVISAMGDLLTTEASRRRVRLEIARPQPDRPANVTDYRARLTKGGRRG